MKIVCESCGAKYSIADEKVAGKVFKIRCKRCSEVIVVRGDQDQAPAEAQAAAAVGGYEAAPDAVWHVVINGDQQGPYTPVQLGEMLTNGTVDWEAYVWMEGFDNWLPMRDVENLVAQITGGGDQGAAGSTAAGGYAAADPYASQPAADPYAAQPSMGADPFADDGGGADDGMFGGGAAASAGPDLFGASAEAASPFDGGGDAGVVASAPSPRVDESAAMTGVRNENSVLFSLKNLQALATGSNAPPATSAPSSGGGISGGAGFATGEGSGLIDIRALASTTGMGGGGGEEGEEKDELLSMGNQTAGFGALGASPMLATASDDSEGGNKTIMVVSIASAAVLAAAGMVTFALLNKPAAPAPAPQVAPVAAAAAAAAPQAAKPEEDEAKEEEEPKSEGELAAEAAKKEAEEADDDSKKSSRRKRRSSGSSSKSKDDAEKEDKALLDDKPSAAEAKPKPRGGSSSLDDLLNGALGGGGKKKASAAPAADDADLPSSPGRNEVIRAMNGVKSAVKACAKGATGTAIANITVKGKTGRVTSAQIDGQTGAVGSCIARAVRKAKFPKFKNDTFNIKYPFRL